MKVAFILIGFFVGEAIAFVYPYNPLDKSYTDKPGSLVEVQESTPIKSQDGIAFCYGFSATSLLETYRCREMNLNCSDPHEALSSFDVTSYYGEKNNALIENGEAYSVLKKISETNPRSIAREECIPFSSLVHQFVDDLGGSKRIHKRNENKGLNYLIGKWIDYKGNGKTSNDCVACLAKDIKTTLGNLKTPDDQIKKAFSTAIDVEDFLYKVILPQECLDEQNKAVIPPFKVESYPEGTDIATDDMLENKIVDLLKNKIPLEIGFCNDDAYTPNCEDGNGHSVALYGIKEVCNKSNECRKMVKIKNSYGKSWMEKNNDGWIDLKELVRSSNSFLNSQNISWITKP